MTFVNVSLIKGGVASVPVRASEGGMAFANVSSCKRGIASVHDSFSKGGVASACASDGPRYYQFL